MSKLKHLTALLRLVALLALGAHLTPLQAAAPTWTVNKSASRLTFSGTQSGSAFNGKFERWSADIKFDPAALSQSRIVVVVQTDSAKTGDKLQETRLASEEWFNTAHYPNATFRSTRISLVKPNTFVAEGNLTIKGRNVPVKLNFALDIGGRRANASGAITLDRITLGMGARSDPTGTMVSRKIQLRFVLSATR